MGPLLLSPHHSRYFRHVIPPICDWNHHEIRGACFNISRPLTLLNLRGTNDIRSDHSLADFRPQSLPQNLDLEHRPLRVLRTPYSMSALQAWDWAASIITIS